MVCGSFMENYITLFVDNLADRVNPFSLRKKFTDYGIVRDAFIPFKRGKISGRRFGFVRFDCPVSADIAVEKANGSRFMDNTIFVKRASYNKKGLVNSLKDSVFTVNNKDVQNYLNPITRGGGYYNQGQNVKYGDFSSFEPEFVKGSFPSYANVVSGKKSVDFKRFSVKTQDIEWLERSIVARLHAHRDVDSISEAFRADGVFNVHIRDMGGNMVLLTFPSSHDMNCMLEGGELSWLSNWFVDVKPWKPNIKMEYSRVVWLNCYGIPINLWNANTFFNIGKLWGEIITLDEATSKKTSFSVGKVKIYTNAFEVINQSIDLEHDGMIYPIKVVEEQVVVNNFMKAICECKGCSFPRVVFSLGPRENLASEEVKSAVEGMDGDDLCLDKRSNVIEHIEENDSSSNHQSIVGEFVSHPSGGVLEGQDKDMVGNNDGGLVDATTSKFLEEVVPDVSGYSSTPIIHEQELRLKGDFSSQIVTQSKEGFCLPGERSVHEAIHKLERRLNRSKRKIRKKKMISEFGMRSVKLNNKGNEASSSSSLSSNDIHNRNSVLRKKAELVMDIGERCGVKFYGKKSFNLKKIMELEVLHSAEKKNRDVDVLIDGDFDDLEDETSLSLEF